MEKIAKILTSQKSQVTVNQDFQQQISLENTTNHIQENEINDKLNVAEQFGNERKSSTCYRFIGGTELLYNFNDLGRDATNTFTYNQILEIERDAESFINESSETKTFLFNELVSNSGTLDFINGTIINTNTVDHNYKLDFTINLTNINFNHFFNITPDWGKAITMIIEIIKVSSSEIIWSSFTTVAYPISSLTVTPTANLRLEAGEEYEIRTTLEYRGEKVIIIGVMSPNDPNDPCYDPEADPDCIDDPDSDNPCEDCLSVMPYLLTGTSLTYASNLKAYERIETVTPSTWSWFNIGTGELPPIHTDINLIDNWILQLVYPSDIIHNETQLMGTIENKPVVLEEGIKYTETEEVVFNTKAMTGFRTIYKHNLRPGDYVYVNPLAYGGNNILRDLYRGIHQVRHISGATMFIIDKPHFGSANMGTFKKVERVSVEDTNPLTFRNDITFSRVSLFGRTWMKLTTSTPHDFKINDYIDIRVENTTFDADNNIFNGTYRIKFLGNGTLSALGSLPDTDPNFIENDFLNQTTEALIDIDTTNFAISPILNGIIKWRKMDGIASEYYLREFEILTDVYDGILNKDYELHRAAFSTNIFGEQKQIFEFIKDTDIGLYNDYLGRPLSEIFVSFIKVPGESPYNWSNVVAETFRNRKIVNDNNGLVKEWKSQYQVDQNPNILKKYVAAYHSGNDSYVGKIRMANNNNNLSPDSYFGDIIEYNPYSLKETVLEEIIHRFNTKLREDNNNIESLEGFYYKPFHRIELKKYSINIEEDIGDIPTENIPNYAESIKGIKRWRDLLDIGYLENGVNGVDYPFLNGCHYIYQNYMLFLRRQNPAFDTRGIYSIDTDGLQIINPNEVC